MTLIETVNCSKCGELVNIYHKDGNTPGWKERQTAHCPNCFAIVASIKTDGELVPELSR
ncbi:hypothetical protein JHW46_07390 [Vibrio splendidus]|nr:hypothetical protein [Vibrio splendidus]